MEYSFINNSIYLFIYIWNSFPYYLALKKKLKYNTEKINLY